MPIESLAELVRFAPDVYGFRWVNHVAMFVVTNAGVVLVDANGQVNPRTPADGSPAMTTLVRSLLHPKYGGWRRFDEFLALNIEGMIAWRAGKSPDH